MKTYTIIRTEDQYIIYCNDLEKLTNQYQNKPSDELLDVIDTITLLIDKYDEEHSQLREVDPIQLLKTLMAENKLSQKELAQFLQVSKGHLSDILNYKKGLSKIVIRMLAERFKIRQGAFNKPYKLIVDVNKHYRSANMMNSEKNLKSA
jgi:HTH-type transcriptional regulator/antitoxin HigA